MGGRIRRRVQIRGRVQGVFFRGSTEQRAVIEGVDGFVRNLRDGRVEAVFEGSPSAVAAMLAFCHQGPRHARVDQVEVMDERPEGIEGFRIT